jgi:hypothetical protein
MVILEATTYRLNSTASSGLVVMNRFAAVREAWFPLAASYIKRNRSLDQYKRASRVAGMEQVMATKPKGGSSGPSVDRTDSFTIVPSRTEVDPFSSTPSDKSLERYLPPMPGPVPSMDHQDDSLPASGNDEAPEQTGERPVFP